MKFFAIALVLLFFCSQATAQEFDLYIDVSGSVNFEDKQRVVLALSNMGTTDVRVVPWSTSTHTPYRASADIVAEHLDFKGGATNLPSALVHYGMTNPVCRKLVVMVDGALRTEDSIRTALRPLLWQNRVVFVELSGFEGALKWYAALFDHPNFVVIEYNEKVLSLDIQDYPAPDCVG